MNKVYIIKPYNPYVLPAEQEIIRYIFRIYDSQYCISEVVLNWGQPQTSRPIEEEDNFGYNLFNTFDEAMEYVQLIRRLSK